MSNASNADRPTDEIEITPEMIAAGASVLYGMELAFATEEFWAAEVYRAMAALAASRSSVAP